MSKAEIESYSFTLVMGGISSGKSEFAEGIINRLYEKEPGRFFYFTPASLPEDQEMAAKVEAHKSRRPAWLKTVECGLSPSDYLLKLKQGDTVLFDSVGTLLGRFLMDKSSDGLDMTEMMIEFNRVIEIGREKCISIIFVSEEVGMTLVALSESGRTFQRMMGQINQLIAAAADEVFFIIAGIPQKLK